MTLAEKALELLKQGPMSAADLVRAGVTRATMRRLVARGAVVDPRRGLYRLAAPEDAAANPGYESWADLARRADVVFCMVSAAVFHGLTDERPIGRWAAIGHTGPVRWAEDLDHVFRWSGAALEAGVETHDVLGVPVRITSPARTIVDLYRYADRLRGADRSVADAALADYARSGRPLQPIYEMARVLGCRQAVKAQLSLYERGMPESIRLAP